MVVSVAFLQNVPRTCYAMPLKSVSLGLDFSFHTSCFKDIVVKGVGGSEIFTTGQYVLPRSTSRPDLVQKVVFIKTCNGKILAQLILNSALPNREVPKKLNCVSCFYRFPTGSACVASTLHRHAYIACIFSHAIKTWFTIGKTTWNKENNSMDDVLVSYSFKLLCQVMSLVRFCKVKLKPRLPRPIVYSTVIKWREREDRSPC